MPDNDFGDPLKDYAEFMFGSNQEKKDNAAETKPTDSDASEAGKRLAAERKRESAFKPRSKSDSESTSDRKAKGASAGKQDAKPDESESESEANDSGTAEPTAT